MMFPITNSVSPTMNRQVIDRLVIQGRIPNVVPFVVQGSGGNIQEWRDNTGTVQANFGNSGAGAAGTKGFFFYFGGSIAGSITANGANSLRIGADDANTGRGNIILSTGSVAIDSIQGNSVLTVANGVNITGGYSQLLKVQNDNTPFVFSPPARSSASPTLFTITAPAHTTLTASTEAADINFNLARTVQFATGALTTQRAFRVQVPTYSFVGASVITTAVTFDIGGAPVAGTNATITNSYALRVNGKINFPDVDVDLSSTTGTKWGRVTDKQAWFGATPIIQPAHANQAAVTDSTTGTPSFTLNDVGAVFSQSTSNGNFATLARQINEIRNVLVSLGKMKGSA